MTPSIMTKRLRHHHNFTIIPFFRFSISAIAAGENLQLEFFFAPQLEHILLRPDTYIGSVEQTTEDMWVWDSLQDKMVRAATVATRPSSFFHSDPATLSGEPQDHVQPRPLQNL